MKSPRKATIELANKRIWEIDFLRGVLIIGMVVDHFMFFLGMFASLYAENSLPVWLVNQLPVVPCLRFVEHTSGAAIRYRRVGVDSQCAEEKNQTPRFRNRSIEQWFG